MLGGVACFTAGAFSFLGFVLGTINRKGWLWWNFFFVARIGDDEFDAVHLPDIPADNLGKLEEFLNREWLVSFFGELCEESFDDGGEEIFTCEEDVIALPVEGVDALEGVLGHGEPLSVFVAVFADEAEFAVEEADAVMGFDVFACDGVVAAGEVGGFAAGDFKAGCPEVVGPGFARGEAGDGAWGGRPDVAAEFAVEGFFIEGRGFAIEPGGVDEVVLRVADPGRGEDFGALGCALALLRGSFLDAWADDGVVGVGDLVEEDFVCFVEACAAVFVVFCGPDDVLVGGVVEEKGLEDFGRQFVFGDVGDTKDSIHVQSFCRGCCFLV